MAHRSYQCFLFRMTKTLLPQQLPTVVHSTISLLIQLSHNAYTFTYTYTPSLKKKIHIHPVTSFLLFLSPEHFFDKNIFSIGIYLCYIVCVLKPLLKGYLSQELETFCGRRANKPASLRGTHFEHWIYAIHCELSARVHTLSLHCTFLYL